jgi:eukaryotic-like serine/threonine-protein kinase
LMAGPYRLETQIGNGGESHVWLATHLAYGTPAVIKVQRSDVYQDRLRRETAVLHALLEVRTPSVVRLLPAGDDGVVGRDPGVLRNRSGEELLYCALELLPCEAKRNVVRQSPMKRSDVVEVCFALRAALRVMHLDFQLLHNDLKPDNIVAWREPSDGRLNVRLLDFGQVALLMPDRRAKLPCLTPEPALRYVYVYGSFQYMPPERWHGQSLYDAPSPRDEWVPDAVVDERADQWSFAASVFELLTGRPLVAAAHGRRFREECRRTITSGAYESALRDARVPARARPALERALALNPADRYTPAPSVSSLDFLCRDLETALA